MTTVQQVSGGNTDISVLGAEVAVHRARTTAGTWGAVADTEIAGELTTATAIAAFASQGDVSVPLIAELVRDAQTLSGAQPVRVGMLALAAPEIVSAPLADALRAHAVLLTAVAGLAGAAVWRLDGERLVPAAWAGEDADAHRATYASAERVLRGDAAQEPAVVISAFGTPTGVLVWVPGEGDPLTARMLAQRSAAQLGLAFERAELLDGTLAQHAADGRSAERRLSRVAFDLHDGPMQDLALLCAELHRVRGVLAEGAGTPGRPGPDPRSLIEDVLAIAEATSTDLRELATSMESSTLLQRPFAEALNGVARAFALRSGVEPQLHVAGDVATLTDMERVTLLRVIGEALANAREHSGARHVQITVRVTEERVTASVGDDGAGFDVEQTLPVAARRGSLGLLGMIERVRLMDGRCDVLSTPGKGTTVALSIVRLEAGARPVRAISAPVAA